MLHKDKVMETTFFEDIITIEPKTKCEYCIIWLHGLGAEGDDFIGLVEQLSLNGKNNTRFIFPSAPQMAITVNSGAVMRAWYDIYDLDIDNKEDTNGVQSSKKLVQAIIDKQIADGVSSDKIILGGFSQGGAMALYVGLRYQHKLAGIIALSTYLLSPDGTAIERTDINANIPIFMAHGLFDPVIPLFVGQKSLSVLKNLQYKVDWHTYPMQHSVLAEEISHIDEFLQKIMQ